MSEEDRNRANANILYNNPQFVQDLNAEELRALVVPLWDNSLTRHQQELALLYILRLMVEADLETSYQMTAMPAPTHADSPELPRGAVEDDGVVDMAQPEGTDGSKPIVATPSKMETPHPAMKGQNSSKKRAMDSDDESYTDTPPKKPTPRRNPDQGGTIQVSRPTTNPLPNLEWVLYIPDQNKPKRGTWKHFNSLSDSTQDELKSHFESAYCTEDRAKKFRGWFNKVVKNSGGHDRLRCVNNMVYIYGKHLPTHSYEVGTMDRACDSCVKTKRICAKLVRIRGKDKLGIYPLPSGCRKTAEEDELGFWVCD